MASHLLDPLFLLFSSSRWQGVKELLLPSPFILISYTSPFSYDPSMIVVVGVREMIHLGSEHKEKGIHPTIHL